MKGIVYSIVGAVVAVSTAAVAEPEPLALGAASTLPGKGRLPRREGIVVATVNAEVFGGASTFGAQGTASLRLVETLGIGAGLRGSADGGAFVRMEAIGLAVNHWSFLGYADYVIGQSWWFGGAMIAPLRRDSYLRLSVAGNGDGAMFGVGMERDVW